MFNKLCILPSHIFRNGTECSDKKSLFRCRFRICWNHHIANSYRGHTSNKDLWRGSESIDYSHCTQNIRWESHNPNSQPENILCNCLCGFLWNSFLNCHIGNTRWVISIFRILPTHISHSGTHRSWRRRWISCMIDICWKTHNEDIKRWNTSNKPSWRDLESIGHSHCNQNIQRESHSPNSQPENTKCNCFYEFIWNNYFARRKVCTSAQFPPNTWHSLSSCHCKRGTLSSKGNISPHIVRICKHSAFLLHCDTFSSDRPFMCITDISVQWNRGKLLDSRTDIFHRQVRIHFHILCTPFDFCISNMRNEHLNTEGNLFFRGNNHSNKECMWTRFR